MRRRHIGSCALLLALAFVLVLAVPDHDRGLALFAFLLLAGALTLTALVLALSGNPLAQEDPLAGSPASRDSAPAELSALASAIRAVVRERVLDERVYDSVRSVASVRLARNHGIELRSDPAGAREVIGGGPLWRLLESEATWARLRVDGREITQIIGQLERL